MSIKWLLKRSLILCLLLIGLAVNIGSGDGSDSDDQQNVNGIWKYKNMTLCNGFSYDYKDEYLEISDDLIRSYRCADGKCYYCSDWDEELTAQLDTSNLAVNGEIMTITVEDSCTVMTLERASESDIDGAEDNCSIIDEMGDRI